MTAPGRPAAGGAVAEQMLGWEGVERLAAAALQFDGQDGIAGVEAVITHEWGGLTRFANSQIHQNVWTEDVGVSVRVVTEDLRVGVAQTHSDDPADVAETARVATVLARIAPPDPEFPGLAPSAAYEPVPVDEPTLLATPDDRARAVRGLLAEVPAHMEAAGAYRTGGAELAVFTSAGQRAYAPLSSADLTLVVTAASSSGYAEDGARSAGEIDPARAARRAVTKALLGADPEGIDAGNWPVVLEPAATSTLVQFLGYVGFGGRDWLEGRSFASEHMGERVCDPRVTILDDALSAETVGFPFDFEGTPKRRLALIRDGVLTGVAHDRWTAARSGETATGHGLPAPNPWGPYPLNLAMVEGDGGSVDDLIAGCERGLLVTRFHYTNVVHPLETTVTGMTRDGTFLIEDGRISRPVRNLRFTQSILGALSSVEAISTERGYSSELFFGGSRCPALRLPGFAFTGTTTFG